MVAFISSVRGDEKVVSTYEDDAVKKYIDPIVEGMMMVKTLSFTAEYTDQQLTELWDHLEPAIGVFKAHGGRLTTEKAKMTFDNLLRKYPEILDQMPSMFAA